MIVRPFTVTLVHASHDPVDLLSALVYVACAIAVGAIAARRPALGVAALFVLAPFDLARYAGSTTITTEKAGLVGFFIALLIVRPNLRALGTSPVRAVSIAFAALFLAIAASARHAQHLGEVEREFLKNGEYFLLFVAAVVAFANDADDADAVWHVLEAGVALVCISAFAEYVLGAHSGIFLHGKAWIVPRIAGVLEGPNQLAGYLDVALPVLVARSLVRRDRALIAVIVMAAAADVLTLSRGGIFGTLAGLGVVVAVFRPPTRIAWVYACGIVAVLAAGIAAALRAGVPPGYFSLNQTAQAADHLGNRAELWRAAIALWHTSPITGVGAGNYELDLGEVGLRGVRTHANSLYLQSLAECGLVGLAATIGLIVTTIVTFARSAVRRGFVVGALGATVALAAHQVVDDMMFFPKIASGYWIVVGFALADIALAARTMHAGASSGVPAAHR